jgi:hypothetical protein
MSLQQNICVGPRVHPNPLVGWFCCGIIPLTAKQSLTLCRMLSFSLTAPRLPHGRSCHRMCVGRVPLTLISILRHPLTSGSVVPRLLHQHRKHSSPTRRSAWRWPAARAERRRDAGGSLEGVPPSRSLPLWAAARREPTSTSGKAEGAFPSERRRRGSLLRRAAASPPARSEVEVRNFFLFFYDFLILSL